MKTRVEKKRGREGRSKKIVKKTVQQGEEEKEGVKKILKTNK